MVKVPPLRVKVPLLSMVESPPANVPPAWTKLEEPTVMTSPAACVSVPV